MQLIQTIRSRNLVPIMILYYAVGAAGLIIPVTRGLFLVLTPVSLLMSFILLYLFHERFSARFWLTSAVIFLAGFLVEMAGVKTGWIFGGYTYGDTLGPGLFQTPLMIGINWLMLVYCSNYIAGKFVEPIYFRAIVAAALMVVYDFALEPVAMRLDMWNWEGGIVPLQNYIAWFFVALLLNYLAGYMQLTGGKNKLALPLFFIQLVFFIVLDIWIFTGRIWAY
jgi:bisanhydrobacterioruberin hydratase